MTNSFAYDSWGLLQFPTSSDTTFTPQFSGWLKQVVGPCEQTLAVIGDYLGCFLVNDGQVGAAWRTLAGAAGGSNAVRTMWLHNPAKVAFSSAHTPALYLWRESAEERQDADDWRREYSVVKGLWVFPTAFQEAHASRSQFGSLIAKAIDLGIERGRTPSWRQPLDPDTRAATQGSLFYTYAGFDEFKLAGWRNAALQVQGADRSGGYDDYPAIDLTFELTEKVTFGLGRSPPYYILSGITDTVTEATPSLFTKWAALTVYAPNAYVVPVTSNNLYYVGTFIGGISGAVQPVWPTTPGATIADGNQTWTCIGPISGAAVTGPLEAGYPVVGTVDP